MNLLLALAAAVLAAPTTEGLPGWTAPDQPPPAPVRSLSAVSVESSSPLMHIKVLVRAGSAQDPAGLEGLAALTGQLLVEGGFGDPKDPMTKDKLAERTRPWGSGAYPAVQVSKEVTTFSMTVPKEALDAYVKEVLAPMFGRPLFAQGELDRLRTEALQRLRSDLRLQEIETLGLTALDNVVHEGTPYAHPDMGTEKGLAAVDAGALRRFYASYYGADNLIIGASGGAPAASALADSLQAALAGRPASEPFPRVEVRAPAPIKGREALVVALPSAISTGLHAAFPLPVSRKDADYWPLYVANVWFGAHRDSFSHLFKVLREARGYNYGDYSYIEHFEGRPEFLFPPMNHPRLHQYFSVWVRPVGHEYAPHVMRAFTRELEDFTRRGLSEEECGQAKNKAKVLYLSLADTTDRILGSRLDDAFYGLDGGYLAGYLDRVGALTCEQINAALKKHLQARDLRYVVVTSSAAAGKLVSGILSQGPVWGKAPADYQIDAKDEAGKKIYSVPEEKLDLLRLDAVWAHYPLDIPRDRIRVVATERMFETSELPKN